MSLTKPVIINITTSNITLEQIAKEIALQDDGKSTPDEINSIMINLRNDNKKFKNGISKKIILSEKNDFWEKYFTNLKKSSLSKKGRNETTALRAAVIKFAQMKEKQGTTEEKFYEEYGSVLPKYPKNTEPPAWCAAFIDMALLNAGVKLPFKTKKRVLADDLYSLAEEKKCYTEIKDSVDLNLAVAAGKVKPGDIILYHRSNAFKMKFIHCAVVEKILPNGGIITIDGNAPMPAKNKINNQGNLLNLLINEPHTAPVGMLSNTKVSDGVIRRTINPSDERYQVIKGIINIDGLK